MITTLPGVRGKLTAKAPLAPLVWFKAGGAAEWLFEPADTDDLAAFLGALPDDMPVMALGLGSNLIVRDGGVRGVVIRLGKGFASVRADALTLDCGAGASGIAVASAARDAGIAGLAFLRGIPGTVGGLVRMNGGAYGREVADCLVSCDCLGRDGTMLRLTPADLHYSYRHSELPDGAIVVAARLQGHAGDPADIGAEMDRIAQAREVSQPLRVRTGGSTFKNPPGARAWELVDRAGCRGLTFGGARVSEKHTNFLINAGKATSAEIEALGEEVRRRVRESENVDLEWEIQRVGSNLAQVSPEQPSPENIISSSSSSSSSPHHIRTIDVTLPRLHVAVLMGGWSSERTVSLKSGEGVASALESRGHRVSRIDMGHDVARVLADVAPDVVFNALHGSPGEDGSVQGLMDLMGLTYTHSGLATSVIAIDKVLTKQVLVPHGIPMPGGRIISSTELFEHDPLPRPYVVKPVNEGSSVGVAIVTDAGNYGNPIARDEQGPWQNFDRLLVEPFIRGRELTVAVLDGDTGPRALLVTELKPKSGFYDFDAKYTDGLTDHICPADIPAPVAEAARAIALEAHILLGCKGTSRSDFRWDDEAGDVVKAVTGLFLLEVNTQPGMTPLSLVPEQARRCGMDYADLVETIIAAALAEARVTKAAAKATP